MRIFIVALPVEIPVFDLNQPSFLTVREDGVTLHFLRQIMGMGGDAQEGDADWDRVGLLNRIGAVPGRDVNGEAFHTDAKWGVSGWLVGEVEAEGGLYRLRFAGRMHVELENQICVRA